MQLNKIMTEVKQESQANVDARVWDPPTGI